MPILGRVEWGNVTIEVRIQSITYKVGNTTYKGGPYPLTVIVELFNYSNFRKCVFNAYPAVTNAPTKNLERRITVPGNIIGNPTVTMGDVKLYAGTSNSSEALRIG